METHTRTILKSLTWRAIALAITTCVALWVTGKMEVAASIGVIDTVIKIGSYYFHERAWMRIKYGVKPTADYEI